MMKKLSAAICIILCSWSFGLSSGLFVTPGSRANSMGGAYMGIADDATAIYWNPAGLTQLNGSGVSAYALYGAPKAKSNGSLKNAAIPDANGGDFPSFNLYGAAEPTEFQNKELELISLLPFASGYGKVKNIVLAGGVYVIGGGGGKWDDSVAGVAFPSDTVNASIDGTFGFIVSNISAAKEINPKLSIGLGINWINMVDGQKIKKEYHTSVGSLLNDYSIKTEYSAAGSGFEATGGALYRPVDNMRAGFIIRSGANLVLNGDIKQETSGGAALLGNHETDYTQNYAYPMTCGFGVSYDPIDDLTLAAGVELNNYSALKTDIDYETETALISDVDEKKDWDNTTQFRFGTEYRMDKLSLRCGVQNDPVPFSRDKLTLLNTNQYDLITLNIGAGYNISSIQVDVSYTRAFSDKPEKDGREYEYISGTYQVAVGYNF